MVCDSWEIWDNICMERTARSVEIIADTLRRCSYVPFRCCFMSTRKAKEEIMPMRHWQIILILCMIVIGCSSLLRTQCPSELRLVKAWESADVLRQPESVVYDQMRKILYVSNINGEPTDKNGGGFLSTVSLEGEILDVGWLGGLNAPKGLAISEDRLYVADIDALVEIDLKKGQITKRYAAAGAKFLNDVTADKTGNVYVSDMFTNSIYRLSNGKFEVWLQSNKLDFPNGLHAEDSRLIVGSWGVPVDGFQTQVPGHLKVISFSNKNITSLGSDEPIGNLDGVEPDGCGSYYVTDWMKGTVFHITPSGEVTNLYTLEQGAADLEYVENKKLLVIPMMNNNKLIAFKVDVLHVEQVNEEARTLF